MNILFPTLLVVATFALFYHFAVRRVLLDVVRFRIFALRDDLRRMAGDDKIKADSFLFYYLERGLCNLVAVAPHLNLYNFGQFVIWRRDMPTSSREQRFRRIATAPLLRIEHKAVQALFWVLFINSPTGSLLLLFTLPVAFVAAAVNKILIVRIRRFFKEKGREFLEQDLDQITGLAAA